MKKAIIYCRTATQEQLENNNLNMQLRECKKFSKENDYKVSDVISEVGSGCDSMRSGLLQLFYQCNDPDIKAVVALNASRVSRDFGCFENIKACLERMGISLVLVHDQSDVFTSELRDLMVKDEKRLRRERIKRGIAFARLNKLNSIK